jgi:uncharacterized 2Fe-2S/4Fe-4S cluster protein (DUF4445 family)
MHVTVHTEFGSRRVKAQPGDTLYSVIKRVQGVTFDAPCGGRHTCGKCKVKASGGISETGKTETELLTERELAEGIRLACCTAVTGDCEVWLAGTVDMSIQTEGQHSGAFDLSPAAGLDGTPARWGAAVDIGTTTVAVYLCDLTGGIVAATDAFVNPQRSFGADVITRLEYIMKNHPSGTEELRSALIRELNSSLERLCSRVGITPRDIGCIALAGNTVMQHIAAGRDARGIANAPFTVDTLFGYSVGAEEAGIEAAPHASVFYMPCFAAYVGGDIAAGLIAAGVDQSDGVTLFIDVGTNGEMGLGNKNGISLCATAAGPAFEGAQIECGMAGVTGAINEVWEEGETLRFSVIGGGRPRGICGSGLIDAVATLLDLGIVDETGRLEENFYLDRESGVYLSPHDIRELQLAKAAVCGGIMTLLDHAGLDTSDVSRVALAGGFGAHINRRSACRIGLIPAELEDKIEVVGNTAGMGAVAYLMSASVRDRTSKINGPASHYLELSGNEFFMDAYVEQMMFPE